MISEGLGTEGGGAVDAITHTHTQRIGHQTIVRSDIVKNGLKYLKK